MKRVISLGLALAMAAMLLTACGQTAAPEADTTAAEGAVQIQLSDGGIIVDGVAASTDETAAVYTANNIVYYEAGRDFTYGEGTATDGHSQAEAEAHTVVHITQPGTYALSGTLSAGQVAVDLGEDADEDPEAVVTLVLNGVDITCTVAPAVIFYHVYECGSADEETASKDVDTSAAGANVVIADSTVNNVTGSYVARIYKPDSVELSEDGTEVADAKKLHKYDGAFYSKMSMNVDGGEQGTGVLNIVAENEGLDSELHLTVNGGVINIASGNDGINTNEDGVSVTTINGGSLNIQVTGETGEGDGIDSNGWLVINGGSVVAAACSTSGDAGVDADKGIYINGGTVVATGNMYDRIEASGQNYVVFAFEERQTGGTTYTLEDVGSMPVGEYTPANDFTYLVISSSDVSSSNYRLWMGETPLSGIASGDMDGHGMGGGPRPGGGKPPEDMEPPEREPGQRPENGGGPWHNEDDAAAPPDDAAGGPPQMTPPGGKDHAGGFGGQEDGVRTEVFAIGDGGSFFTRVAPAE